MLQYEPFRVSTEHLNDGETLRARLAEDGRLGPIRQRLVRRHVLEDQSIACLEVAGDPVPGIGTAISMPPAPEPTFVGRMPAVWEPAAIARAPISRGQSPRGIHIA